MNNDSEKTTIKDTAHNAIHTSKDSKFNLNAEEFIPRAYRSMEPISVDPNLQFINIHPNFVPLPLINHHLNEMHPPGFNPAFLPPPIPLNFMSTDPKLLPNFVNFIPHQFVTSKASEQPSDSTQTKTENTKEMPEPEIPKSTASVTEKIVEIKKKIKACENVNEDKTEHENLSVKVYKNEVDIAKIVSKLEEAAKEQTFFENRRQNFSSPNKFSRPAKQRFNSPYQNEHKTDTYKQNFDKRKPRRFEPKTYNNTDPRQVETTISGNVDKSEEHAVLRTKSEESQTDPQIKTEFREIPVKSTEEERKYSPRHQNYRNQNSPRKYPNYINKNSKGRTVDINNSISTYNYSDTLKKSSNYSKPCPRYEKYANDKTRTSTKSVTINKLEESTKEAVKPISSNKSSQWISVSNKKKRKNKSNNEDDTDEISITQEEMEIFEDVLHLNKEPDNEITPVKVTMVAEESSSNKIDHFIEMVTSSEPLPIKCDFFESQVILQDIKDIENELLKDSLTTAFARQENGPDTSKLKSNESPHIKTKSLKEAAKKKTKKSGGKSITKRIIILDPQLSKDENLKSQESETITDVDGATRGELDIKDISKEIGPNVLQTTEDLANQACIEHMPQVNVEVVDNKTLVPPEVLNENTSTPDKKKSRKKKKPIKVDPTTNSPSISSSSTTLNNIDDSYDFLLNTTTLVDDKTNIEVSEELDKMIQKGLFGNLEEKFKSLNVSVDDDFFKSLSLRPKTQSTPEKGFIKATNFTTILNNNNQTVNKPKLVDDSNKIDVEFSKIKFSEYESQPSTSRIGEQPIWESEIVASTPTEDSLNTKSKGKLKNKSKKNILLCEKGVSTTSFFKESIGLKENKNILKSDEIIYDCDIIANEQIAKNEENSSEKEIKNTEECVSNDILQVQIKETTMEYETVKDNQNQQNNQHINEKVEFLKNYKEINDVPEISTYQDNKNKLRIELNSKTNSINEPNGNIDLHAPKYYNECSKVDIKITNTNDLCEDASANHELNYFNGNPNTNKLIPQNMIKDQTDNKISKNEESDESLSESTISAKPLYPITRAVREWMTKTRETTPEVEILKSPDTIYKEFIDSSDEEDGSDSDTETNQKNGVSNPSPIDYFDQNEICHKSMGARVAKSDSENETTVCETWSMSQATSIQEDNLLDCWEPDIVGPKKEDPSDNNEVIEEAEDVLVYESKCGKNDDFLRLKTEIEKHNNNGTFPKHGNLPYRAICCSLM